MAGSSDYTKLVRVKIEKGWSGGYFASSPDLPGLQVAAASKSEVDALIPKFISDLYQVSGQPVIVSKVQTDADVENQQWAAIPLGFARSAVEASASTN